MSIKSLCYFVPLDKDERCYFDSNYVQRPHLPLNGLFAFVHYNTPQLLMVLGKLNGYGSQHSGIDSLVRALKQQATAYQPHFFSTQPASFQLPHCNPIAGGAILFLHGNIVFWHLKSGSFSRENTHCHDESPQIEVFKKTLRLPQERFMTFKQADFFDTYCLRDLFQPDGQYTDYLRSAELADTICRVMLLPPMQSVSLGTQPILVSL